MKKTGLPIVLALGLGCPGHVDIYQRALPLRYLAREVRLEPGLDSQPYLSRPVALVQDKTRLFVLDMGDDDIKVFSKSGAFECVIGRKGQGPGEFHLPSGLDILGDGLYVADSANRRVQVVDTKGRYLSGFRVPFSPHRILAFGPDRIVVMSLPSGRDGQEKMLYGFDGSGQLLWEAIDSFYSGDSVYDLMRNRWFMLKAPGREFFLVPGANGRRIRRLDENGILLGETEVTEKHPFQAIDIPSKDGKKRTLHSLCWNCALDRDKLFLLVPERTGDGDLGPGKMIVIIDKAGEIAASIALPECLVRIAVDGNTIFGIDLDARLRIFRLEPK
jgi:hypothetical protein